MFQEKIPIEAIVVPKNQSNKLKESIAILSNHFTNIVETNKSDLSHTLLNFKNMNLLSVGFPLIISKSDLDLFQIAINIHPTLLPKYRGPTTGAYIILNNEKFSGSSVHYMVEEMDKGLIIAQSSIELSPFETTRSLQRKVYETEPDLIITALKNIEENKPAITQNEHEATIFPKKRTPLDSELDSSKSLMELVTDIRAADHKDFPAFFFYHGEKVYVKLWREDKAEDEEDLI